MTVRHFGHALPVSQELAEVERFRRVIGDEYLAEDECL